MFSYSTVSTLKPTVEIVVTYSLSFNLYGIVVFSSASRDAPAYRWHLIRLETDHEDSHLMLDEHHRLGVDLGERTDVLEHDHVHLFLGVLDDLGLLLVVGLVVAGDIVVCVRSAYSALKLAKAKRQFTHEVFPEAISSVLAFFRFSKAFWWRKTG